MRIVSLSLLLGGALLSTPFVASAHGDESSSHETYWFGHPGKAKATTRTVKIEASELKFAPATLTAKVGETVRFEITNSGKLDHEFMIGDVKEQVEHDKEMASMPGMAMDDPNGVSVAPGKTATLIWTFTKAGQLQYGCHVPGHYLAGMVGQLTVQ